MPYSITKVKTGRFLPVGDSRLNLPISAHRLKQTKIVKNDYEILTTSAVAVVVFRCKCPI